VIEKIVFADVKKKHQKKYLFYTCIFNDIAYYYTFILHLLAGYKIYVLMAELLNNSFVMMYRRFMEG